ncbi:angiotensin-converting enzyme-like [Watersipora subatra]|uniref:angiotensin-converting enzyme-like n=1 Tax=Watersipora subatra TaxID=2589382 RepID=UPI00355C610A
MVSISIISLLLLCSAQGLITDENAAWEWFYEYSDEASTLYNRASKISWNYSTNITDYNEQKELEFSEVTKEFSLKVSANASLFDFENFSNSTLKKAFKYLADKGVAVLNDDEFKEYNKLALSLESTYGKATLCDKSGKELFLEPEMTEILATSRDPDRLLWIWKNWRDATGKRMRKDYLRFTELLNKASKANGYEDAGDDWRTGYNVDDPNYNFRDDLERLYRELKPFYKELHTYVKNKLKAFYGEDKFPPTGHIPAHLLGNMWAQTWVNIEEIVMPYAAAQTVNATPAISKLTVNRMFEMSDDFFASLGLNRVTDEFWANSMLEKPTDGRDVVCHASAWDFNDGKDFRIKQCTRRNMEDFVTVHHEMGHIQYYMQYAHLPISFRGGANPGFHEAVGDVLALSVATPEHLKKVDLIDQFSMTNESQINFMMSMALEKIVFLPFGKLMDDYRWAIFDGSITPDNLNAEWWKRRCTYQGISPPVTRTEDDFDPGAKYHIPANVPYVRYFVSFVLQFQFHKALCRAANHVGPLYKCDIYQSQEAGKLLGDMLKLGSSQEWPIALEAITGSKNISADPLVEYFQPLMDWLKEYNKEHGYSGDNWDDSCPTDLPEASSVESAECVVASAATHSTCALLLLLTMLLLVRSFK